MGTKPTIELITAKYNLDGITSDQMKKLMHPTGLRSKNIWDKILLDKITNEQSANRLTKFQAQISKGYTGDDLMEINGAIGFKASVLEVIK